ncbi:thrombopoietin-like [Acanthopagrus schlegelii]
MAYSRLLLLLIGVITSHLPEVQAAPIDFWCNPPYRRGMANMTEELKDDVAGCVGSDTLSSPVQLPKVGLSMAEWENKTIQQKRSEVIRSLEMFQDGVRGARNQTTVECQTRVLEQLGTRIANYLLIVKRLQLQNDTGTLSHSAVQSSSQTSLNNVLDKFGLLLKGKLEYLAIDLKDSVCKVEHGTT